MIAILLSTYNGASYLREQLNSLFNQTFKDFILYVIDDGSNDETIGILCEYESNFSHRMTFFKDNIKGQGACRSFLWLLERVEADYYMFCDQDDVWLESKIELSVEALKHEEQIFPEYPILLHTDLTVTDAELNIIYDSLWLNDNTHPDRITRKYLKFVNYITGCTMLFNRKARDLSIVNTKNAIMHDYWVAITVESVNGKIISLPIKTIFYRQHNNNAVGASTKKSKFSKLQRYLHLPDFKYSMRLYNMIKLKYNINFLQYLLLRINFYLKH